MGTSCALHLFGVSALEGESLAKKLTAEAERLEAKYSRYRESSLLSHINRSAGNRAWIVLDKETRALLDYVDSVYDQSGGVFDITSGVLRNCWDFRSRRVPSDEEIAECRGLIGWRRVQRRENSIQLPQAGMELDLGGVVKEYAADRLAAIAAEEAGVTGLIDLGGDMRVIGSLRQPLAIGVRGPYTRDRAVATIPLASGAIASSGDYERSIEVDGVRYGHLLDPVTGWPVQGIQGVSVWAPSCIVAGSVATVAMLKNESDALHWLRAASLPFVGIDRQGRTITARN